MNLLNVSFTVLLVTLVNTVRSLPFRAFSSRSVPGRLRASSEPDLKDYLSSYLEMMKQQQLQNPHLQYNLPEYEPVYQQGYLSRKPEISPETIAALLPYLYQSDGADYSYDYNTGVAPQNAYSDDDGTWYDDATAPELVPGIETRDKTNQDAALIQLFLDHLAGKYSLEDLETLERQAAIEDNSENQLQALMNHKKSKFNVFGTLPIPKNFGTHQERKGQKEEPFAVPATSIRKPVFTRSSMTAHKWEPKQERRPSFSSLLTKSTTEGPKEVKFEKSTKSPKSTKINVDHSSSSTSSPAAIASTTMEPAIKSAYEAFLAYLDQERFLRKTADEAKHSKQKRFISDPKSLTQQLASLKKNVT